MRTLATMLLLAAGEAIAHPGHGDLAIHLHGWEYGLLAALLAAIIAWVAWAKK
jgi:hypothetical protein